MKIEILLDTEKDFDEIRDVIIEACGKLGHSSITFDGSRTRKIKCKVARKPKFNLEDYKSECVMHCDTEEKANIFCKFLHDNGRKWFSGHDYLTQNLWFMFKEETCYEFNGGVYQEKRSYKEIGYKILEFDDYDWS